MITFFASVFASAATRMQMERCTKRQMHFTAQLTNDCTKSDRICCACVLSLPCLETKFTMYILMCVLSFNLFRCPTLTTDRSTIQKNILVRTESQDTTEKEEHLHTSVREGLDASNLLSDNTQIVINVFNEMKQPRFWQ